MTRIQSFVVAVIIQAAFGATAFSDDSSAEGVNEFLNATREINYDRRGFWPDSSRLAGAKRIDAAQAQHATTTLTRFLNPSICPGEGQWSYDEWLSLPKRRAEIPEVLIGRFTVAAGTQTAQIQFQTLHASGTTVALTLISEELFPNKSYSVPEIKGLLAQYLNIPDDCLQNLDAKLKVKTVGDSKDVLVFGTIFDRRHKDPESDHPQLVTEKVPGLPPGPFYRTVPIIPESKREWFSPMEFWISKGRFCVTISTVDWKKPGRPMSFE